MYAVIKAGGKQHRVKPGDVIEVELTHRGQDESVSFRPLLVVDDDGVTHVGKDLGKAQVTGKLVGEEKGEKIRIFKYRPKSGYARRQGHRQMYTLVEIEAVNLGGARSGSKKAASTKAAKDAPAVEEAPGPEDVGATPKTAKRTGAAKKAPAAEHPATAEPQVSDAGADVEGDTDAG